ncbi:hypothetical protein [Luteitalea sp.]|uniref:hypothetical protein n=1 Tax=Luteitalea sp. TaxID=2004800 RepID=UPI0025C533A5|nr:hypothetical protein [Luteitalea sp.]
MATTPGSVRGVRQALEGQWQLERFEWVTSDGISAVAANGRLTYDRFGLMTSSGSIGQQMSPDLTYEGRAMIDVRRSIVSIHPVVRTPITPARVRRFAFLPDARLQLDLLDHNGLTIGRAIWRRVIAP